MTRRCRPLLLGPMFAAPNQIPGSYRVVACRDQGIWVTYAENLPTEVQAFDDYLRAKAEGYSDVRCQRVGEPLATAVTVAQHWTDAMVVPR
jgi:hypothetical protein